MQSVLVTGAGGFLGRHLCRALAANGAEVWALGRHPSADPCEGAQALLADAADLAQLRAAFRRARPELVFHLAGHVTTAAGLDHVIPSLNDNLVTAVNAMVCAAELGCRRFIMAASLEEPEIGDALPSLGSPYAASKWAARAYGKMFTELYGLPVVHGRVFLAYGPGQAGSGKLIPYTIESLLSGVTPRFKSESRQVDWVYIDDAVSGLITLASAPDVEGTHRRHRLRRARVRRRSRAVHLPDHGICGRPVLRHAPPRRRTKSFGSRTWRKRVR